MQNRSFGAEAEPVYVETKENSAIKKFTLYGELPGELRYKIFTYFAKIDLPSESIYAKYLLKDKSESKQLTWENEFRALNTFASMCVFLQMFRKFPHAFDQMIIHRSSLSAADYYPALLSPEPKSRNRLIMLVNTLKRGNLSGFAELKPDYDDLFQKVSGNELSILELAGVYNQQDFLDYIYRQIIEIRYLRNANGKDNSKENICQLTLGQLASFCNQENSEIKGVSRSDDEVALWAASKAGYVGIVRYLVESQLSGLSVLENVNNEGYSALYLASQKGRFSVVKYLYSVGLPAMYSLHHQDNTSRRFDCIDAAFYHKKTKYWLMLQCFSATGRFVGFLDFVSSTLSEIIKEEPEMFLDYVCHFNGCEKAFEILISNYFVNVSSGSGWQRLFASTSLSDVSSYAVAFDNEYSVVPQPERTSHLYEFLTCLRQGATLTELGEKVVARLQKHYEISEESALAGLDRVSSA